MLTSFWMTHCLTERRIQCGSSEPYTLLLLIRKSRISNLHFLVPESSLPPISASRKYTQKVSRCAWLGLKSLIINEQQMTSIAYVTVWVRAHNAMNPDQHDPLCNWPMQGRRLCKGVIRPYGFNPLPPKCWGGEFHVINPTIGAELQRFKHWKFGGCPPSWIYPQVYLNNSAIYSYHNALSY